MKVLFINPPWYRLQGLMSTYPPMGSLYMAAILEKNGFTCSIWNADYTNESIRVSEGSSATNVAEMTKKFSEYRNLLNDLNQPIWKEVRFVIEDEKPDIVGLLTYTASVKSALNTAEIAKEVNPECRVVCGGPHATIQPEDFLYDGSPVDFVVRGEGETAMLLLSKAIAEKNDCSVINNLVYRENGNLKYTEERKVFEDMSKLPTPAKHLIRHADKLPAVIFQPIFTARGCPHQCIYCSSFHIFGRKPRLIPVETVIQEIIMLKNKFNVHHFFICDDTFAAIRSHAIKLLDSIIDLRLDITWGCQTRGEKLDEELVRKMKKAGCTQVSIGVETGSPRIRTLIKKGNTNEDIEQAVALLKKYRIQVAAFFMFGFPSETHDDIEQTVAFMKKLDPYNAHCNIATPDPGTEFMELVRRSGLIKGTPDWTYHFHQSPEMFFTDIFSEEEKIKLIGDLQKTFDAHNKKHLRLDLIRRAPLYARIIIKEKLYKHPNYLLGKLKDLL